MLLLYYMKRHWKNLWLIKKIDEKESEQLKQIYNHYVDKKSELMKNTQFKFVEVFTDVISKDTISTEQITKLNNFWAKMMWIFVRVINLTFFKPREKK